jgi:mono/diheme cytochrome c family protein
VPALSLRQPVVRIATGCLIVFLTVLIVSVVRATDSEQIKQGAALFQEYCIVCHGENGQGGAGYANPIWGKSAQIRKFKNAQGLFEYHQLLMPFNDPSLLDEEQKWAVTAFLLVKHEVLKGEETLEPAKAAQLAIP